MSYDISVEDRKGKEAFESVNITYNMAPMFQLAFEDKKGIWILDGLPAEQAAPLITKAYQDMYHNKEKYDELNPSNGWGSRATTVDALKELLDNVILGENCVVWIH